MKKEKLLKNVTFLSYIYVHMHQSHASVFLELFTAQTSYIPLVAMVDHSSGPSLQLAFTDCDKKHLYSELM